MVGYDIVCSRRANHSLCEHRVDLWFKEIVNISMHYEVDFYPSIYSVVLFSLISCLCKAPPEHIIRKRNVNKMVQNVGEG